MRACAGRRARAITDRVKQVREVQCPSPYRPPRFLQPRTHHRRAFLQPLARAAGGARHPSLHRHGLWLFACSGCRYRASSAARSPRNAPTTLGFFATLVATNCDWKISMLGWTFTLFFVFLGSSAAVFGHWLETAGPRKAGLAAALCWCGGLLISALGVYLHQIWMLWLGSGVIGGIGLGPRLYLAGLDADQMVSGPARHGDRPGHHGLRRRRHDRRAARRQADGLFATPTSPGVWQTFVTLAAIYFVFMVGGRARLSRAARRLGARGLDAARARRQRAW